MPPAPHPSKPQATLPYLGGAIRRSMLTKFDDYAIHQTPEPIAHPASSDRNVYDRYWFNGYADDGEYYFSIGMGLYPNRGIIDCGFSVDPNETGIECNLTFTARTACVEEGRQTLRQGVRPMLDSTRFAQFGRWRGTVRYNGKTVAV